MQKDIIIVNRCIKNIYSSTSEMISSRYKLVFSFNGQTVMVSKFIFQIRKMSIYCIACIGDIQPYVIIPCK